MAKQTTIDVYESIDGSLFQDEEDADKHSAAVSFDEWYKGKDNSVVVIKGGTIPSSVLKDWLIKNKERLLTFLNGGY